MSTSSTRRLLTHSALVIGGSTLATLVGLIWFRPTLADGLCFVAMFALSGLGVSVAYHRLLAHRSFRAPPVIKAALLVLGASSGQGPPAYWAVLHRAHHRHSDRPGDPHSPLSPNGQVTPRSFFHAHFGWITETTMLKPDRHSLDVLHDPIVRRVGEYYPWIVLASILLPGAVMGMIYGSVNAALHGLIWGGGARIFAVHHVVWSVNSVCHTWGSQRYRTGDASRNNWLVALLSFGEGWHNNHHIAPASARFGMSWWQLDVGYLMIRVLASLGLATHLQLVPPSTIEGKLCSTPAV